MIILGQAIGDIFTHPDGTEGLAAGDFATKLFHNGEVSMLSITFAEKGDGDYKFSFTPDAVGIWVLKVAVGDFVAAGTWDVQQHPLLAPKVDVDIAGTVAEAIFDGQAVAKNPITQPAAGAAGTFHVKDADGTTDRWTGYVNDARTERTLD